MDSGSPALEKLLGLLHGDLDAELELRFGVVLVTFHALPDSTKECPHRTFAKSVAPARKVQPASDPQRWENLAPPPPQFLHEMEIGGVIEEVLSDRHIRIGIDLPNEVVDVALHSRSFGVPFGMAGHENMKAAELLDERDQLVGIPKAASSKSLFRRAQTFRNVSSESQQFIEPGATIVLNGAFFELAAGQSKAGHVGYHIEPQAPVEIL